MKKTKILAPALGILALSMAASVTGTVAWFSSNATVTAEGMTIKATTATNLYIRNSEMQAGVFQEDPAPSTMYTNPIKEVDDITDNGNLVIDPTSTDYAGNFQSWYKVAKPDQVKIGGEIYESSGAIPADTFKTVTIAGGNVQADAVLTTVNVGRFYLYLSDVAARNINATVTLTAEGTAEDATATQLKNVVRFAMIFSEQTAAGDKEVASGLTRQVWSLDGDSLTKPMVAEGVIASAPVATKTSGSSVSLGNMVPEKTIRVDCYFWFEGQDAECINQASLHSNEYSVDISFSATAA